jgi:hypothetical protein
LITDRVAHTLQELKVKSCRMERMTEAVKSDYGFTVGALSAFLPEDLAIRYGDRLVWSVSWLLVGSEPRTPGSAELPNEEV